MTNYIYPPRTIPPPGTISGTIAADQVAFGTGADTIGGSNNFTYVSDLLTSGYGAIFGTTGAALDGTSYFIGRDNTATNVFYLNSPASTPLSISQGGTSVFKILSTGFAQIGTVNYSNTELSVGRTTTTTAASQTNIQAGLEVNPTGNVNNKTFSGIVSHVDELSTHNFTGSSSLNAGSFFVDHQGSGTVAQALGVNSLIENDAGTLTTAIAIKGSVFSSGGTIGTAIGLYAAPFTSGGTINTSYGAKIDAPGTGGTQWTLAVDTGNSYFAGTSYFGSASSDTTTTVSILGGATNNIALLRATGGAWSSMVNSETPEVFFDLSQTKNFAGNGAGFNQSSFRINAPTYTATAAQTLNNSSTFVISGPPTASTNITITNAYAAWIDSGNARFDGNIILGAAASGATAANGVLAMSNGATAPTTSVDLCHLYCVDNSAGHATLGVYSEEVVAADVALASTHSYVIQINGTKYKVMLVAA